MIGIIAGLAISSVLIGYLLLLTELVKPGDDDEHQADYSDRAVCLPPCGLDDSKPDRGAPPARFAATWPAPVAAAPPWQPRISAGRVTTANMIRFAYALADQPIAEYLASLGWPAQEVVTCP